MDEEERTVYYAREFSMGGNSIMSSDFLTEELEVQVLKDVENGSFLIRNEQCVNAYAYREEQQNIVAISLGSIYKCLYTANLFMLKDDFIPEAGEGNACYSSVSPREFPLSDEGGEMSFYESGDEERRNIGHIIAALALKFMVYHEIGHHVCGHLERLNGELGLDHGEAQAESCSNLTAEEFRKLETEADLYSVEKILKELDELCEKWSPYFEVEIGHLELVQLLTYALVIVKENLGAEADPIETMETGRYLPKLIRVVIGISTALLGDSEELMDSFRLLIESDPVTVKSIESYIGPFSTDNELEMMKALNVYLAISLTNAEQTYADIFYGRHDPIVFQPEILIAEWWERNKLREEDMR